MNEMKRKRVTMKLKTPNPLFEKWIIEWRDKARAESSKMEYCFNKALDSLRKYPVPLENGRDCKILKGFGDKICKMLDNKLKEYERLKGDDEENLVVDVDMMYIRNENIEDKKPSKKKKQTGSISQSPKRRISTKEYIPQEGSGGYAILVTLYNKTLEPNYPGYLTKLELIREGQHLSNTSFTKPDPGSRYTAWSSMGTLLTKNLVIKKSNPAQFSLTDEGFLLAIKLCDKGKNPSDSCNNQPEPRNLLNGFKTVTNTIQFSKDTDRIQFYDEVVATHQSSPASTISKFGSCSSSTATLPTSSSENSISLDQPVYQKSKTFQKHSSTNSVASSTQSSSQEECVIFPPGTFDIILYIDTCETSGSNVDVRDDPIQAELNRLLVAYEVKSLKVGDYIWICRDRITKKELVLPYIVERKRMDDLGKSIKDGRYHEQKFRLKKSGIQNITYLVEKYGNGTHVGLPITTLYQACTNTAIQDGFCVKFTENSRDTAKYLAHFSLLLSQQFKSKTTVSCPKENLVEISLDDDLISLMTFKEFNQSSSKNKPLKVSDLFVKMLIQIKGISVDRALAIVREYPTPAALRKAYREHPGTKGEKLLAHIQFGDLKKTVGVVISKTVHQLFTMQSF